MIRTWGGVTSILLALLCSSGCRQRELGVELVTTPESLVTYTEPGRLDFGSPEADSHLLRGWGPRQRDFRWSTGDRSSLSFFLAEPRSLRLRLWGRAFSYPGAPPQEMIVVLNGNALTSVEVPVAPEPVSLEIELPELSLAYDNVLEFEYSAPARPIDVLPRSRDSRLLAVAWHRLEWVGAFTAVPPRNVGGSIELPPGTGIAWSVPPRRGARVEMDLLRCVGTPASRCTTSVLDVELVEFGPSDRAVHSEHRRVAVGAPLRIELTDDRGTWLRLHHSGSSDGSSLRLEKLRLIQGTPCCVAAPVRESLPSERPNVLVFLVDTLRADGLGTYGHGEPTSPRIDAFAKNAVRFEEAVAAASWTRASVASIMTGLETRSHGTVGRDDGLAPSAQVLPEILRRAGYRTHAVFTNSNASPWAGFDRGFDSHEHLMEEATEEIHQPSGVAVKRAIDWLESTDESAPWFLYVHVTDPHDPYLPREKDLLAVGAPHASREVGRGPFVRALERDEVEVTDELLDDLGGLYDGEIHRIDEAFGALWSAVRSQPGPRETLVVFVSDHGEEFYEHRGWTHARTLYREVLRIPLVIRFPGAVGAGRRIRTVVRQVDILPTVLDVAGVEIPPEIHGRSLAGSVRSEPVEVPAAAELDFGGDRVESVRWGTYKLIERSYARDRGVVREVYDLVEDPSEQRGVAWMARSDTQHFVYLLGLLRSFSLFDPPRHDPAKARSTAPIQERLKALGYL